MTVNELTKNENHLEICANIEETLDLPVREEGVRALLLWEGNYFVLVKESLLRSLLFGALMQ